MPREKDIIKYLKVKALAESGAEGERANAQRIVEKMERENPGIREAAKRKQEEENRSEESDMWQDQPTWDGRQGNWENIFRWAGAAFNGVYGFAETMADAVKGRRLAEEVTASTRMSRTGKILITLRLPLWVYEQSMELNRLQRQAFRQHMHELLEEELNQFLGED